MLPPKTLTALHWIIPLLNSKNIPYQITGGLAAKLYGSKRDLNDIDIEIPENRFDDILEDIKPYVTEELHHHKMDKWDCMLTTLDFKGQEIDISGAYEVKVTNKERTKWIDIPADFLKTKKMQVEGMELNVVDPQSLIDYKEYLDGDHQVQDIEAVKEYINNS